MHILILGNSLAAISVCRVLADNHEIRVITNDKMMATHIEKTIDCQLIFDDPLAKTAWQQAHIEECEAVIALTSNEEKNIIACQIIAKYYHIPLCICNVGGQYYPHKEALFTDNATKHIVLSVEQLLSIKLEHMLRHHHCQEVISTAKNHLHHMSIKLTTSSPLIHQPFKILTEQLHQHEKCIALYRNGTLQEDTDSLVLTENDTVLIVQDAQTSVNNINHIIGKSTPYERIIIAGVSQTSIQLLSKIQDDYTITLIEPDIHKAQQAASQLQNIVVVHGNINDDDLLQQEGIRTCDAFIALSTDDENNLACALQACNYHVSFVSTLISQEGLIPVVEHTPIHSILSSQGVLSDHINKYTQPDNVIAMHHLDHHQGIIIELQIPSHAQNLSISALNLPSGCIAYGVYTDNTLTMHTEKYTCKTGDNIHLFCKDDTTATEAIARFNQA